METITERYHPGMTLVAGVDSSTQSTKVLVCDADTGEVVRRGAAPHPEGTEVHPDAWEQALRTACDGGLLDAVRAFEDHVASETLALSVAYDGDGGDVVTIEGRELRLAISRA